MQSRAKISIDGVSASGKGTLASMLADFFSLPYMDTGRLYRLLACDVVDKGLNLGDHLAVTLAADRFSLEDAVTRFSHDFYKKESVARVASNISAIAGVRAALLGVQREFVRDGGVLDGRDIGSVVIPDADYKFYITADIKIRAVRRHKDLLNMGYNSSIDDVLESLSARDISDETRGCAPLVIPDGAFIIDTSRLNINEVFDVALLSMKAKC